MPDMKEIFSSRLKKARIEKGITQAELSRLASLTPATVSAYEKGQKLPNLSSTAELAKALDVTIDWLCGIQDQQAADRFNSLKPFEILSQMIVFLGMTDYSDITVNDETFNETAKITFTQPAVVGFIAGFKKLKELYDSNVLSKELFDAGINGLIDKYKNIEIEPIF